MSLLAVEGLLSAGLELVFFYAEANPKLHDELVNLKKDYPNLDLVAVPFYSRKLQGLLNRFESKLIKNLAVQFQQQKADAVLSIQGDVELSSRGVLAGKMLGIPSISYIPYAHMLRDMGAKFGRLRDLFNQYLLNAPDVFVTITREAKAQFSRLGSIVPVDVVYNGIDIDRSYLSSKESRQKFNLPDDKTIIAVCGRLEVQQKGQDFLLESISRSPYLKDNVLTLIVGDGPDEQKLKSAAAQLGIESCVRFMGWTDTSLLYPALDILTIPSRFEGMPLVMLEAIHAGVPVVGSDRDGMREILPAQWQYPFGDHEAFIHRLTGMIENRPLVQLAEIQAKIRTEMSVQAFQNNFLQTILEKCQKII